MKKFLRRAADTTAVSFFAKPLKSALYPFARIYSALKFRENQQQIVTSEALQHTANQLRDELCVRSGPFQGMKYGSAASAGSALYPKLLGTYEREITPFVEDILAKEFELIIDVGCAEGYYAVGFARRFKGRLEKVIAYDTDKRAQALCAENAKLNDALVEIGGFCDDQTLIENCSQRNSLIFVDAEGYEKHLISDRVTNVLRHCTFLIESHDFINLETTRHLLNCFSQTHITKVISSIDDIDKAYEYTDLDKFNLSLSDKKRLFAERRPAIMKWIYATPQPQQRIAFKQDLNPAK